MDAKTLALYLGCSVIATSSKLGEHKRKLVGVFQDGDHQSVKLWFAGGYSDWDIDDDFKLLLRPLSSMTEEECKKLSEYLGWIGAPKSQVLRSLTDDLPEYFSVTIKASNWLREKSFDCDGLIEKGEAIESPNKGGTMTNKEELKKKFDKWTEDNRVSIEIHVSNGRRCDDDIHSYYDGVFDFFYSEIEAREKQIQEIKKGFEERIKELEPKKSDYWNGARNAYVSSLNFINRKTDDKLDSMHGHTEIVG